MPLRYSVFVDASKYKRTAVKNIEAIVKLGIEGQKNNLENANSILGNNPIM
jgi:hypothetical protein